jgi:hypothetical protein
MGRSTPARTPQGRLTPRRKTRRLDSFGGISERTGPRKSFSMRTNSKTRSQIQGSLLAAIWPPTSEASREAGHEPMSPLKAIREKCRDCSCYQLNEIRACEALKCPLWPFRAGRHPWLAEAEKTRRFEGVFERQPAFRNEGSAPKDNAERAHAGVAS